VFVRQGTRAVDLTGSFNIVRFFRIFVLCAACALLSAAASAQQPPEQQQKVHQDPNSDLPPGPGRDTFIRVCSKCHSPNNVIANPQNQQGWEDTITKMVGFGATGTDAEFSEILGYLVKNFPATASTTGSTPPTSTAPATTGPGAKH
jgi:competence protein ComEA